MKILFIGDICGIASLQRKYLKQLYGIEGNVVQRVRYDLGGVSQFYKATMKGSSNSLKTYSISQSLVHDVVHVHAYDTLVRWVKWLARKPIVLQYHGSDIRWRREEKRKYYKHADQIIVSTPDLLEDMPEATYLPNPVDTELFVPRKKKFCLGTAFHFLYDADDYAKEFTETYSLSLVTHDRSVDPIPYYEMPQVLSKYEYYVDVRRSNGKIVECLSRTALEALACGVKVINWKGEVLVPPLPNEHNPEVSAEKLKKIYDGILKK